MTTTIHNLPQPSGAMIVDEWQDDRRYFTGESQLLPAGKWSSEIRIQVQGMQLNTGPITYELTVDALHPDRPISADEALRLAGALIEAARNVQWAQAFDADRGVPIR